MNVRLLRKVAKHISEEPRRFVMNSYLLSGEPGGRVCDVDHVDKFPACGTAACIAGWSALLNGDDKSVLLGMMKVPSQVGDRAQVLLGITREQRERLFHVESWPRKFKSAFIGATTAERRAILGSKRIEHFIKTKGAE